MADNVKDPEIRQIYKPLAKEEEMIDHVYDRFNSMKDNTQRAEIEKEWDRGERAWDQAEAEDRELEDWQADYYVPLTTGVVESMLSEMIAKSPRPIILPLSQEDKPKTIVMKHAFEFTWSVADGDDELESVLKDCLIYGDGFAQEYYWKDRRMVKQLAGMSKNGKNKEGKYNEVEVFDYDDCYMESVSPYELYFDEMARQINRGPYKARDAIRRMVMKKKDAEIFFSGDIWNPFDNMKYVKCGADTNYYSHYKPPEDVNKGDEVEVLWYWARRPEDWLCITINDVMIKMGPNPYKHKQLPFAKTSDVKRPHKFYHKGEPKLLESIQKELNTIRRMITDRNHLDIDKMFLVDRNETFSDDDTITRPGGTIRVDDPANYKPLEYGDIPQSVGLTLSELNKDSVRVTGAEERFQAVKSPGTATEAAILQESVKSRISSKLRRLEKGFLIDIGRMRVANIIQFYSQPKLKKIIGESGTQEYERAKADLQRRGLLTMEGNNPMEMQFREIRLEGKELVDDARGKITERPTKGFSFFTMKPEDFVPVARGGFDIRFEAGSTMPVSKSLMIKQSQDTAALLMPLALQGIGYDPVKLGDMILEAQDQDPENLKLEKSPEESMAGDREQMLIDLAMEENKQVSQGSPIPPMGTQYATPGHTRIHIAYLKSQQGMSLPENQYRALAQHAMGEVTAQQMRGDVTGSQGAGQPSPAGQTPQAVSPRPGAAPYNQSMKAAMPARIQGGEEVNNSVRGSAISRAFSLTQNKQL